MIFETPNWFTETECQQVETFVQTWPCESKIYNYGRFPNRLIANQYNYTYSTNDILDKILKPKLDLLFENYTVAEVVYQELHLPWDVHCDLERPKCIGRPWQSILVPFSTVDSVTVIFEQTGTNNHFYKYKETAQKLSNAVDIKFWNDKLDHCWDEDREFLSLKYVSNSWSRGSLLSFPRNSWHSSDNFHKRINKPKKFLQVLIDQDI
jgi:hypothetical protein